MKQARVLSSRELKRAICALDLRAHSARNRAIIMMSHLAGLRAKELAAIQLQDVFEPDFTVRRTVALSARQTKGKRSRTIRISTKLVRELANYSSSLELLSNLVFKGLIKRRPDRQLAPRLHL